jgi:CubicO group peptidase (beta-lactamase class C family)
VSDGWVAEGFEPVRVAFDGVLAGRAGTGAAVAVWHRGDWVVDLWGGTADAAGTRAWQRDSIVQPYSVSKPFAAVCALLLVARGALELDAPVARYWPEFVTPATVRQVLSHQAGVVALSEPAPTEVMYDWDRLCALLAAQQPAWPPGTAHGESALFYGHLVGELVRRVDGRSLGRFLREEVCGPLELDFAFGIGAADQARAVDLGGFDLLPTGEHSALYAAATGNPAGLRDPAVVNSAAWRSAEIPAVNGHGTARGIAGLYAALLRGELLPPELLRAATTAQCAGPDAVMGGDISWGLGFAVDADGYGMGGLGGNYAGVSNLGQYAIAFVTGTQSTFAPLDAVENPLRDLLGLPPL